MLYIKDLQNICTPENIAISKHAAKRLKERDISVEDIINAINTGDVVLQLEKIIESVKQSMNEIAVFDYMMAVA